MEAQVNETVYSLFGITPLLNDLDEQVVRPLNHLRYGDGPPDTPRPPKMIFISGPRGCGHRSVCSALVNELRRGRSNKRGDVHYKNRDVKYLEWNYRNRRPEEFAQVFTAAKDHEFTVLTMHGFDHVCPSAESRLRLEDPNDVMKTALTQQLDEIQPGKILVVASSTRVNSCDAEILDKMDYKYNLTLPDAETREEIILQMLEYQDAELTPPTFIDKLIHATRHDYSNEDLAYVVNGAIRLAKARQREQQQQPGREGDGVLKVMPQDWARFLDIVLEDRENERHRLQNPNIGIWGEDEDEEEEADDEQELLDARDALREAVRGQDDIFVNNAAAAILRRLQPQPPQAELQLGDVANNEEENNDDNNGNREMQVDEDINEEADEDVNEDVEANEEDSDEDTDYDGEIDAANEEMVENDESYSSNDEDDEEEEL